MELWLEVNCAVIQSSKSDILEIRRSKLSPLELARQFNVTVHNIYAILKRKTWRHV